MLKLLRLILIIFFIIFACASCTGRFRVESSEARKATPTVTPTETPTEIPTEVPTEVPADTQAVTQTAACTMTPEPTPTAISTPIPSATPIPSISSIEALRHLDKISTAPMPGCSEHGFWYTTYGTRVKDANGNDVAVYPNEMPAALKELADKYRIIYRGDVKTKKIYLTFTAGFENEYVDKIFELLHEKNVPAAFFVTGAYTKNCMAVNLKKAYQYGFIIGGHGYWHEVLPQTSTEHVFESLQKNEEELQSIIGPSYKMKYFRAPYGYTCERDVAIADFKNIRSVFWTFLYNDFDNNGPKKDEALSLMKDAVYPGSVFYLHATSDVTFDCLPEFIDYVRSLGYEFGSIEEIG